MSETLEEEPKKGMTPLAWAARRGHREVVKMLLDDNSDVNVSQTNNESMALYGTAWNEIVKVLLENNADVSKSRHR